MMEMFFFIFGSLQDFILWNLLSKQLSDRFQWQQRLLLASNNNNNNNGPPRVVSSELTEKELKKN